MQLQEDRSAWELEDWAMLVVCGVVALGAAGITLMLPQKSRQRCA